MNSVVKIILCVLIIVFICIISHKQLFGTEKFTEKFNDGVEEYSSRTYRQNYNADPLDVYDSELSRINNLSRQYQNMSSEQIIAFLNLELSPTKCELSCSSPDPPIEHLGNLAAKMVYTGTDHTINTNISEMPIVRIWKNPEVLTPLEILLSTAINSGTIINSDTQFVSFKYLYDGRIITTKPTPLNIPKFGNNIKPVGDTCALKVVGNSYFNSNLGALAIFQYLSGSVPVVYPSLLVNNTQMNATVSSCVLHQQLNAAGMTALANVINYYHTTPAEQITFFFNGIEQDIQVSTNELANVVPAGTKIMLHADDDSPSISTTDGTILLRTTGSVPVPIFLKYFSQSDYRAIPLPLDGYKHVSFVQLHLRSELPSIISEFEQFIGTPQKISFWYAPSESQIGTEYSRVITKRLPPTFGSVSNQIFYSTNRFISFINIKNLNGVVAPFELVHNGFSPCWIGNNKFYIHTTSHTPDQTLNVYYKIRQEMSEKYPNGPFGAFNYITFLMIDPKSNKNVAVGQNFDPKNITTVKLNFPTKSASSVGINDADGMLYGIFASSDGQNVYRQKLTSVRPGTGTDPTGSFKGTYNVPGTVPFYYILHNEIERQWIVELITEQATTEISTSIAFWYSATAPNDVTENSRIIIVDLPRTTKKIIEVKNTTPRQVIAKLADITGEIYDQILINNSGSPAFVTYPRLIQYNENPSTISENIQRKVMSKKRPYKTKFNFN